MGHISNYKKLAGVFVATAIATSGLLISGWARAAGPAFVQVASATPQSNQTTVSVAYSKAQVAGDTNIIAIGWNDTAATISNVTDSKGNIYSVAAPITRGSSLSQAIYYAKNISTATANSNTITVTFNAPAQFVDLRATEYSGLDTSSPLDKTAAGTGSSGNTTTSSATTAYSNELIFGAGMTVGTTSGAGTNFTKRIITSPDADIAEDRIVSAIGSYNATAKNTGSWVMQMATFKAAGSAPDTTPPSVPTGLTGTSSSPTQTSLSWTASTDNVGVTGYKVYRNGVQVATTPNTSYVDTGLTAGTTYTYTVAAYDAAGNTSAQSSPFNVTTQTPDTTPPSVPTGLSANAVSTSEIDLSWTASTDNVGVTGYKVYRNGTLVTTVTATSYNNTGLAAGTSYSFTVSAIDAAGNESAQSAPVSQSTQAPDTTPPSVPTGLSATAVSSSEIDLSWSASTDNVGVAGYNVYRNGVKVGSTSGSLTYKDTGLAASTTYAYSVSAFDAAGNESAQSSAVNATTQTPDTTPPSVPTGLTVGNATTSQLTVTWSASTDNVGVVGYHVFRNGTQVATTTTASYQDSGLTANTTYSYTVSAFDAAGNESAQSAAANGTTQALPAQPFLTGASSNGRYLVDQNGNPFLINGDSDWNLAWALNSSDQQTFLADRAADGFNTVLTDLVGNNSMSGHTNGANYNGDLPFTGSNFTPNSAYWSKIDTFFQLAKQNGISVFADPIDFYATENGNVFQNMTNAQALAYGQFLTNRYPASQYPGIVWILGNDYGGDGIGTGCCGSTFTPYQSLLTGLGTSRLTTAELGFYETVSSDGLTIGQQVTLNSAYDYHPSYSAVLHGYAAKDEPVYFLEGAYENATTGFPSSPLDLRKQLGWSMTSGASGSFYGNDSLWEFGSGWQNLLDSNDALQRKAFNAAFSGINWWTLQPDTASQLVTSGRNTQYTARDAGSTTPFTNDSTYGNYVTAAYSSDGTLGVIYNPDTTKSNITVSGSVLGANPTITAVDPTNGARTNLGWTTTPTMGANAGGDHDWLFIINASPR